MAWFVAGVAAERSGVGHHRYRVNGWRAAALHSFCRYHTKTDRIDAPVLAGTLVRRASRQPRDPF
jgi:hypothetical protein